MSSRSALLVCALLAACDDDGNPTLGDASAIDAFEPPWFTPEPGEAKNWDIQLVAPFDVSTPRAMYVVDLWDVATAMTFDYGNGMMIDIPAGPLAGKITDMHAAGAKVVCRTDVGAIALDDPDASLFPGSTNPPDRTIPPEAGSVVGWSAIGDPNTRYLDESAAAYAMWKPVMLKRLDLAQQLGCDAIGVARVDQLDGGFAISGDDETRVYTDMVAELHQRELSAGIYVDQMIGKTLADGFADSYDFQVTLRCAEFDDCELARSYVLANKAVFGLDFELDSMKDRDGDMLPDGVSLDIACTRTSLPADWIQKDADDAFRPSSAFRADASSCP